MPAIRSRDHTLLENKGMIMKKTVLALLLICTPALADKVAEKAADKKPADKKAEAAPADAGKMDPKKMAEEMAKFAAPVEQHKMLAKNLVGKWTTVERFWMGPPNAKPMETQGSSEAKAIMGDRYVEEVNTSSFMGTPFEGRATFGFDKRTNKYVWSWIDTAGTGVMHAEGTADATGKTVTFATEDFNMEMKKVPVRFVFKFESDKKRTLEMYEQDKKAFEIVYTRSK